MDMCTLPYLKWITNKNYCVQHRELCSAFYGSLDGREVWGRVDTCICTAESLDCSPETVTALFVNQLWWCSVARSCLTLFFVTPWTVAHQASLSFTISWSLSKFNYTPIKIKKKFRHGVAELYGNHMFNFIKMHLPNCFLKWFYHSTLLPAI